MHVQELISIALQTIGAVYHPSLVWSFDRLRQNWTDSRRENMYLAPRTGSTCVCMCARVCMHVGEVITN